MEKGSSVNEDRLYARFNEHFIPVTRFTTNPETRKRIYIRYYNRCNENVLIFKEVVLLRDEAARLLGYRNYATLTVIPRRTLVESITFRCMRMGYCRPIRGRVYCSIVREESVDLFPVKFRINSIV